MGGLEVIIIQNMVGGESTGRGAQGSPESIANDPCIRWGCLEEENLDNNG